MLNTVRNFVLSTLSAAKTKELRMSQATILINAVYPTGLDCLSDGGDSQFLLNYERTVVDAVAWSVATNTYSVDSCILLVGLAWHSSFHGKAADVYKLCLQACDVWPLNAVEANIELYRVTATIARELGDTDVALNMLQRVLSSWEQAHPAEACIVLQDLGDVYWSAGDLIEAERIYLESLQRCEAMDLATAESARLRARAEEQLGNICRLQGDPERALGYVKSARENLKLANLPVTGFERIRAWMYLQEANILFDLGLNSAAEFARWWQLAYFSANVFQNLCGDSGLAYVAERALRTAVHQKERGLVQQLHRIAQHLRILTGESAPIVDQFEYLTETTERAVVEFGAIEVPCGCDRTQLREELVLLLRKEFETHDRRARECCASTTFTEHRASSPA